jgi:hypothetical protein
MNDAHRYVVPPGFVPTGHYRMRNIFAVGEWAIAEIKKAGTDADGNPLVNEEIIGIADWCYVWLENDPRDNGGDASVRRGMRSEWPSVYALYRRFAS